MLLKLQSYYITTICYIFCKNNIKFIGHGSKQNKHETNIRKSKEFPTKKMENNGRKITEQIIEKRKTKFVKLGTRIETLNRNAQAAESLAEKTQNNISNRRSESTAFQEKLAEQAKKIHKLGENIEDQINRNSRGTLAIRDTNKENHEKTQNNTSHVLSSSLYGLFGQNPNQFLSDIERGLRDHYKTLIRLSM